MPQEPKFIQVAVSTTSIAGGPGVRKTVVALDANGDVWEYAEATKEHWFKLSPTRQD